jgi:tellurite resistance protein
VVKGNKETKMTETPPKLRPRVHVRPKAFPPPEFPPRKVKLFAKMPPAVFPVLLGLLGLGLALRRGFGFLGVQAGGVEAALGAILALFGFALIALGVKIARRPSVVIEDMRVLPGRAGFATASMGIMASAAVLAPYSAPLATAVLWLGLALHSGLALLWLRFWFQMSPEARGINPAWHLSFVGFIVGAVSAVVLGLDALAQGILLATMPIAAAIWGVSLAQLISRIPPAPLRPLLAIHLAPAALFATVAQGLGQEVLAYSFAGYGAVILLALLVSARWVTVSGFSPLWGSFTFPLTAYASALISLGGGWGNAGVLLMIAALGVVPVIAYRVLKMWASGALAAKTNAAEA